MYLLPMFTYQTTVCDIWNIRYQVIRHYHGHLSAVHDISLHPTIDVLVTCGRDSTARVMYQ